MEDEDEIVPDAENFVVASLPEDHKFYTLVGRVASEWSQLEHICDMTIWELCNINSLYAACITSQIMGVGPRCKVILNLLRVRGFDAETVKRYRRLMADSYEWADRRARIIHDPWYLEAGENKPAQFRAMPCADQRFGFCEVKEDEILGLLKRIKDLQITAHNLLVELRDSLSASPETPDPESI